MRPKRTGRSWNRQFTSPTRGVGAAVEEGIVAGGAVCLLVAFVSGSLIANRLFPDRSPKGVLLSVFVMLAALALLALVEKAWPSLRPKRKGESGSASP